MEIEKKITSIITGIQDSRSKPVAQSVTRDTDLRNDLGLDSLDLAELTVRIEAEFDVDIFENRIVNTVGEILDLLQ